MRRVAEGIVSANRAGFGFVRIEGQEEAVFLPPPQMAGVMHGDRVRVSVEKGRDGRYSGRLERSSSTPPRHSSERSKSMAARRS